MEKWKIYPITQKKEETLFIVEGIKYDRTPGCEIYFIRSMQNPVQLSWRHSNKVPSTVEGGNFVLE